MNQIFSITKQQIDLNNSQRAMVVVPCYNEEKRLDQGEFIKFADNNPHLIFLFVNDGSTDGTLAILEKLALINPLQFEVLDLEKNGGKAEAVRRGLEVASKSDAEFIGYWDADLATPLYAINDFLKVAERLDDVKVVSGSRRSMLGHKIQRKFSRRIVSRSCALLARVATNIPVSDTQCGAKIFRNGSEIEQAVKEKFTAGWLFDVELFARLSKQFNNPKQSFYEYALLEWTEIPGSKVDMKAIIRSGFVMLKLIAKMRVGAYAS